MSSSNITQFSEKLIFIFLVKNNMYCKSEILDIRGYSAIDSAELKYHNPKVLICINNLKITNKDIKHMTNLEIIYCAGSNLTEFECNRELRKLNMVSTAVTDLNLDYSIVAEHAKN